MLIEALRSGGREWNEWRANHPRTRIDLRDADLANLDLEGEVRADLSGALLCGANLRGSRLRNADLSGSNLGRANLRRADLSGALLVQADLRGADLRGANLSEARLDSALLVDADLGDSRFFATFLDGAVIGGTRLGNVDLSRANGLGTVRHVAPSEVSVSTLLRSRGLIPLEFLAGAGVPGAFATLVSSATKSSPLPYCGIVSSGADSLFAERLCARVRDAELCAWILPVPEGDAEATGPAVEAAASAYDKLIIVLSRERLSEWARALIQAAKYREMETAQEWRQLVFVGIESREEAMALMEGLGSEWLSPRAIHDFARWTHDDVEDAFSGLLRDLLS